jgi:cold shock CspA family protein
MILPIQITYRNMEPSQTVEGWIGKEAAKLDEFYNRIMGCRVVVELPSRRRKWGGLYHVRIDLTVPGAELVVKRQPTLYSSLRQKGQAKPAKNVEVQAPHKQLRQAINDAFKDMGRQLQDFARRQRRDVKTHQPSSQASVSKLLPAESYGFLDAPGGREIYFHKNSVLNGGFNQLKVGAMVTFVEEEGEKGPQASTVKLVRKRTPRRLEEKSVLQPAASRKNV